MEDDDTNGNALQTTEKDFGRETSGKQDASLDFDKQYDRVKVRLFCCTSGALTMSRKYDDILVYKSNVYRIRRLPI